MKEIKEFRKAIDKIDNNIVDLLVQRFELSKAIGLKKKEMNAPILVETREDEILQRLSKRIKIIEKNKDSSPSTYKELSKLIKKIYSDIFKASRRLQ